MERHPGIGILRNTRAELSLSLGSLKGGLRVPFHI